LLPDELFLRTHKRKSGAWVDTRSEDTYVSYWWCPFYFNCTLLIIDTFSWPHVLNYKAWFLYFTYAISSTTITSLDILELFSLALFFLSLCWICCRLMIFFCFFLHFFLILLGWHFLFNRLNIIRNWQQHKHKLVKQVEMVFKR
jgi:hypothetical protein